MNLINPPEKNDDDPTKNLVNSVKNQVVNLIGVKRVFNIFY